MRKWFYAGAVAGGILLLGAAPAQADVVPAPAGGLLSTLGGGGGALDPSGGLGLSNPLGGEQLLDLDPGQNSADVSGPTDRLRPAGDTRAGKANRPSAHRATPADLPLIGGLTSGESGAGGLSGLIPADLPSDGFTPDGRSVSAGPTRESALFDGGVPLLGGLGGLLPANESPRTLSATGDAPVGMPAGGTPVDPADEPVGDPTVGGPGMSAGQPADDPRLHEEPTDDEAGGKKRSFSDSGRPIAGEDEDFR